jgi:hypothetical protein
MRFLMIINYLNLIGIPLMPTKTYSPLIVNPDAVLSFAIAGKFLKTITWRDLQIVKSFSSI